MTGALQLTHIGEGTYRVTVDGHSETVYIAGPPDDRWVWWNGEAFRIGTEVSSARPSRAARTDGRQALSAPMPARVARILVTAGAHVKKGETLLVLEAMKMELPLRALDDATVVAVRCHEGQLVQPDTVLVELN
jgi:acetyl/propionyl-CoA carboxylase alpha subunit